MDAGLGAQVFGVRGKAMSGLMLRFGHRLYWGEIEFTPIWLTSDSADFEGSFLGNQWGFYFALAPIRARRAELLAGLGLDIYHLWKIHGDEVRASLSLKLETHFRVTPAASVFASLRGYPLHSEGLELGVDRRGERFVPLLGSVGGQWWFQ